MRGVEVEIAGSYDDVFWVWGLHDEQTAGFEHAQSVFHDLPELREADVFDDVKRGNDRMAVVWQCGQMSDCIALRCGQTECSTGFEHALIEVHAERIESSLQHQFKPLATTATKVECFDSGIKRFEWLYEWQILLSQTPNGFPWCIQPFFKGAIEQITHWEIFS